MKPASNHLSQISPGHGKSYPELRLVKRAEANDVPVELVRKQNCAGKAFTLACDSSGLDDKEIYLAIPIDAGTFSKIKSGRATLQAEYLQRFCHVVNNRVYPEWLAFQIGCTLVVIRSEAERKLDHEITRRERAEAKNVLLTEILQGLRAA